MLIIVEPLLIMTMRKTLTSEMYDGALMKVLTTTYNSGAMSKKILDIKTGMPLDIIWVRPLPRAKVQVITHQNCRVGRVGLTMDALANHYNR